MRFALSGLNVLCSDYIDSFNIFLLKLTFILFHYFSEFYLGLWFYSEKIEILKVFRGKEHFVLFENNKNTD